MPLCQGHNEHHVLALGEHHQAGELSTWHTALLGMHMQIGGHLIDEDEGAAHVLLHLMDDKVVALELHVVHVPPHWNVHKVLVGDVNGVEGVDDGCLGDLLPTLALEPLENLLEH